MQSLLLTWLAESGRGAAAFSGQSSQGSDASAGEGCFIALIRAFMAGAILALAAVFAVSASVMSGSALIGALLFPVGVCMLYLLGFDLLTGVFMLTPLAWLDKRPGASIRGILRNWALVFAGNFLGESIQHGLCG